MDATLPAPAETAEQTARRISSETQMLAAVNVRELLANMTERGLDQNAKFSEIRDALDVNLRVAAKFYEPPKQQSGPAAGAGFSIKIILPGSGQTTSVGAVLEHAPAEADTLDLSTKPAYLPEVCVSNLLPDLPAEDADA